jgi:hypothetical protein
MNIVITCQDCTAKVRSAIEITGHYELACIVDRYARTHIRIGPPNRYQRYVPDAEYLATKMSKLLRQRQTAAEVNGL